MTKNKPKVLLVEDEDLVAMLTEDMLTDLGYEIAASVATLESGLNAAQNGTFDVAVLDVNLRGKHSFPIADVLAVRGVPFVFASGYATTGIDRRHADAPTVQKPFTVEKLQETLLRVFVPEA